MATLRKIKLNNCSLWLGNATEENKRLNYAQSIGCTGIQLYGLYSVFGTGLQALLPAFISKARQTYGFSTVAAIMGNTAGFNNALAYNSGKLVTQQFNEFNMENEFWFGMRVDFTPTNAVATTTFSITITSDTGIVRTYSTVAVVGDTTTTIATRLFSQMNGSIPNYVFQLSGSTIRVFNRNSLLPFTYIKTANISASLVNLAFKNAWIDTVSNLKTNIGANPWIVSAYVANPLNSWGTTEALSMVNYIDELEFTLYFKLPNERFIPFRDRQLIPVAAAANSAAKTQKFYTLFSAEPTFLGGYLRTNGIESPPSNTPAEEYWQFNAAQGYSTDTFPFKNKLSHEGFVYFDYNNMISAPSVQL